MKFRKITIIALIAVMAFALAACGAKTKTLESYISKDKTAADEINKAADEAGMTVDIKDNTVTYIYDISNMGDTITEELAKLRYYRAHIHFSRLNYENLRNRAGVHR